MSSDLWIAIGSLASVLAIMVSYLAYRETHSDRVTQREANRVRAIVHAETEIAARQQLELAARLDAIVVRQNQIAADIHDQNVRIGTMLDRLAVMETKIEVFWKSVAMDAAKIIHSPDPRRAHIDALLESFMSGTLTPDERRELREVLAKIRDHEHGTISNEGFPIYPGEQIAAAILLRTMEHAGG